MFVRFWQLDWRILCVDTQVSYQKNQGSSTSLAIVATHNAANVIPTNSPKEPQHERKFKMPKITIEIDDNLDEIVNNGIQELKDSISSSDYRPDRIGDIIHEISDSLVPVYTKQIDDIWYLHKQKLIDSYEDAGLGDNPLENNGMSAIYCYISSKLYEWHNSLTEDD